MTTATSYSKQPDPAVANPTEELKRVDAYRQWQKAEGVKVITDFAFESLDHVELGPWERKGGRGAIINIPLEDLPNDCQVVELKPGGASEPEHHVYEEMVYVVSGRGATSVWTDEKHKQTFEWGPGSLFAIPINAWYQHFNGSGQQPARYIGVTNAPPMMRLFHNNDFIFNCDYPFSDRFGGEDAYFNGDGKLYTRRIWETNFVADAINMPLYGWKERGAGGINVMLELASNSTACHISQFPVGTYKKAHRHGPGAHLVILSGDGFSLLWHEGEEPQKAPWTVGGMVIVPSEACFHQHFNAGTTPARYLALRGGGARFGVRSGPPGGGADVSIKQGGWQVEYEDENPKVHEIFEDEVRRHGGTCKMKAFVPYCNGEVGPTQISQRD